MGLLSIMGSIARKKLDLGEDAPVVSKTPTPAGLHQGSIFELPDVEIALAQADGSIIRPPSGAQVVSAVGTMRLFGLDIYNAYLTDGTSYVQLVTDGGPNGKIVQARLWCSNAEVLPQTQQDWEWWLGSYQRDANGDFIRDANGVAVRADWGTIGWPQFQIDGPPAAVYNRTWSPGSEGIDPVTYTEVITDAAGAHTWVNHEAMEYHRTLNDMADSTNELVLVSVAQEPTSASVNVFVGLELHPQDLKIIRS